MCKSIFIFWATLFFFVLFFFLENCETSWQMSPWIQSSASQHYKVSLNLVSRIVSSHLKLRCSFRRRSTCARPLPCLLLLLFTRRCAHQRSAVTWRLRKVAHIRGEQPAGACDARAPLHLPRIRSRVFHRSAPCRHLSGRFNRPGVFVGRDGRWAARGEARGLNPPSLSVSVWRFFLTYYWSLHEFYRIFFEIGYDFSIFGNFCWYFVILLFEYWKVGPSMCFKKHFQSVCLHLSETLALYLAESEGRLH